MQAPGGIRPAQAVAWLRAHDPALAATRRAGRTALVMPTLFALCSQVFHSPTMASFAAFGSFSMLLLVEFTGPMVQRLRAHVGLAVAWAVLICDASKKSKAMIFFIRFQSFQFNCYKGNCLLQL